MSTTPILLDFATAAAAGPALAGGKGAHLGFLARYGLPVPDGFVISTAALEQVMDEELAMVARQAGDDSRALADFRSRLEAMPLPTDLAAALADEIKRRGWENIPLAVRSSAPMEDSARASFAGIHHSELNVVGLDAIAAAVKRVWASLWTPRAVAYRRRLEIAEAGMAVVIMPMLSAVAAGVAFSCDPVSGRDDRVVINAVAGLADTLVSGQVSGEEIALESDQLSENHGIVHRRGPASGLTDAGAVELAALIQETAFALDYSAPWYDIEWVWDGKRFYLVQARPVTARPWHTYPGLIGQTALWSNGNTRDVVPHPMCAGEWAISRRMADAMLEQGWRLVGYPLLPGIQRAALFSGRLYLSAALIQWEAFDAMGVEPAAINRLLGGHHPEITVPPVKFPQRVVRAIRMVRFMIKSGSLRRLGQRQLIEAQTTCAAWRAENLASLGDEALVQRYYASIWHTFGQKGIFFLQGTSGGSLSVLLNIIERYLPGESHALGAALLAGGEPSVTARQGYEIQSLATLAAGEPAAAALLRSGSNDWQSLPTDSPFRRRFAAFLETYGHRAIYESYLHNPRWREDPSYLLRRIADLVDHDPVALTARQGAARSAARERLDEHLPFLARRWVEALVKTATTEANDREASRSALTAYTEIGRRILLEVGRRLAERRCMDDRDQVFHLTPQEFSAALAGRIEADALRHRIADREKLVAYWRANPAPYVILEKAGTIPDSKATTIPSNGVWRGTAVGAGLAVGKARIIRQPEEGGLLASGDVLVAPSTDPAWTPMFLKAGALVMETGGYLSHGAIVAREFGIPAVVNLPGILATVSDGDTLEVDGGRGTVRRVAN